MKNLLRVAVLGLACLACLGGNQAMAQTQPSDRSGRGNFDPAQMRQRRLDDLKDQLEVKDDAEWKAIQPLVEKVMDAQQAVMRDRMGGMFGSRRRSSDRGGSSDSSSSDSSRSSRFRGFFGEPSQESQTLQKAIESKASSSELKQAIAKFQAARKQKMADLEAAQDNLRKVLSVRQEAIATESGLL